MGIFYYCFFFVDKLTDRQYGENNMQGLKTEKDLKKMYYKLQERLQFGQVKKYYCLHSLKKDELVKSYKNT